MKARLIVSGTAACALLIACGGGKPAVVSQSGMNASMLERVKSEGSKKCSGDGGLKGVVWAYSALPGGGRLRVDEGKPVPYSDLPASIRAKVKEPREQYQTSFDMINLARAAPSAYSFDSDWRSSPEHSSYICQDGVEKTSRAFVFVP